MENPENIEKQLKEKGYDKESLKKQFKKNKQPIKINFNKIVPEVFGVKR